MELGVFLALVTGSAVPALLDDARAAFKRDGFYIVRSAFEQVKANDMAGRLTAHAKTGSSRVLLRQHPLTMPVAEGFHNSTNLHSTLSDIFGGTSAYRAMDRAEYSINKLKTWHRDMLGLNSQDPERTYFQPWAMNSTEPLTHFSIGPDGETQNFLLAAAYLQDHGDNDGALTVRVGTHRADLCCTVDGTCPSTGDGGVDCRTPTKDLTLHPRLGDVILMDFRVIHRSALHLAPRAKPKNALKNAATPRILVAMGYAAQDSIWTEASERHYALRDAAHLDKQPICKAHWTYSVEWIRCVRDAAMADLQREPLPRRSQRCDPSRPPGSLAGAGLRAGCPLATEPFTHSQGALNARGYFRNQYRRELREGKPVGKKNPAASRSVGGNPVASKSVGGKCDLAQRGCSADRAVKPPTMAVLAAMESEVAPPAADSVVAANRAAERSVFIVGASRGIGLGLSKVYAAAGYTVHATARMPQEATELAKVQGVQLHALDVLVPSQLSRLRSEVAGGALGPIGTLIYNAGIRTGNITMAMIVNSHAAFDVVDALMPAILRSADKKLCIIASDIGSVEIAKRLNKKRSKYPYTISKKAVTARFVKAEPAWRQLGVAAVVMSPGYVKTALNGGWGDLSPVESATAIKRVLDNTTLASGAGLFFNYNGSVLPW